MDDDRSFPGTLNIWLFALVAGYIITIPAAWAEAATLPTAAIISRDTLKGMANAGQSDQAIKLAQDYLKIHENSVIRVLLAQMLAWNRQFDAAREQLYFVLSKHPGDYDASDCLSDIEMSQGNYQRALSILANALKFNPGNEILLEKQEFILAKMQVAQAPHDQAMQIAETWLKSHDSPIMQKTKISMARRLDKAIQVAETSLSKREKSDIRILLGLMLSFEGQYDEARTQFEAVLKKNPHSLEAAKALANVELRTSNNRRALAVVENGLQYHPNDKVLLQQRKKLLDLQDQIHLTGLK